MTIPQLANCQQTVCFNTNQTAVFVRILYGCQHAQWAHYNFFFWRDLHFENFFLL